MPKRRSSPSARLSGGKSWGFAEGMAAGRHCGLGHWGAFCPDEANVFLGSRLGLDRRVKYQRQRLEPGTPCGQSFLGTALGALLNGQANAQSRVARNEALNRSRHAPTRVCRNFIATGK
ncbi:MAG: hypothetical protein PHE27_08480 [Alphaproteobacteria bacterium]|nr:hypothetical protein [Alphaproteobacteria bacterium]